MSSNYFAALSAINVNDHIEKKGGFSYLSWPWAVSQLRLTDPAACWEVKRFDGLPYLACDIGVFVEVAVTVQGITLSQLHPVLDGRNRPILAPTSFDINTSIQRCLVKAIALHGLGLYIYAGEDLPQISTDAANDPSSPPAIPPAGPPADPPPAERHQPVRGGTITAFQQGHLRRLIAETGIDSQRLLEFWGVSSLKDIGAADFPRVLRSLEKRRSA